MFDNRERSESIGSLTVSCIALAIVFATQFQMEYEYSHDVFLARVGVLTYEGWGFGSRL